MICPDQRVVLHWEHTMVQLLSFFFFFFVFTIWISNQNLHSKLMLWLLRCLDGESSSGESPIPQIRSIGQFLLSRLFSSLVLRSGFSWVPSLVRCLLHFWCMTSCTYDVPRSACSVALETYHGASTIILRILDWLLWIIDILDLLAQPHNSRLYVQITDLGCSKQCVRETPLLRNKRYIISVSPWEAFCTS
jgi:hypothetical protein